MVTGKAKKKPANWIESRGVKVQPKPSPLHWPSGSESGASDHATMSPNTPTSHAMVMAMNARLAVRRALFRHAATLPWLLPRRRSALTSEVKSRSLSRGSWHDSPLTEVEIRFH